MPFIDDAGKQAIDETIAGEFDMLLGRRTYEIFASYWPNQGDNPIAQGVQQGDEIRRHAQPRPTRLEELAAHRR